MSSLVPYVVVLIGLVAFAAVLVWRRRGEAAPASRLDRSYFGNETTDFISRLDSWLAETPPAPAGVPAPPTAWSQRVFREIEWRRFEAVCASLFAQGGFEANTAPRENGGGLDIWLYARHAQAPAALVHCRYGLGAPVGIQQVREFHALMTANQLTRGTYATNGSFAPDARDFAKSNGITPMDGISLLALISQRTHAQQKELLAIAYDGDYWRPTCIACGTKMVKRVSRRTRRAFWSCADHPRCRQRMDGLGPT